MGWFSEHVIDAAHSVVVHAMVQGTRNLRGTLCSSACEGLGSTSHIGRIAIQNTALFLAGRGKVVG